MTSVLQDDDELVGAMRQMKFVQIDGLGEDSSQQFWLINLFHELYANTDQDTVAFGAEFYVVVRNIFEGKVPVQLVYLCDFKADLEQMLKQELPDA